MLKPVLKYVGIVALWTVAVLFVFSTGLYMWGDWNDEWSGYNASQHISNGYCNVAVLPVFGDVISYPGADKDGVTMADDLPPTVNPDDVASFLQTAEADENILGILVEIDSHGGSGFAGDTIANKLKLLSFPVAALVRESANSAGYMIATGADIIIASSFSDVGSIGVTMSYFDNTKQNEDAGLEFISLASGKFKDSGILGKPLTDEERTLFERDLKVWHDAFVKNVSVNRDIPIEDVVKLADGSSMAATLAQENKLIDAVGDEETVRAWFAEKLGISSEEVVFCN